MTVFNNMTICRDNKKCHSSAMIPNVREMSFMRGYRISEFGGLDVLKYVNDLPIPAKPTGRLLLVRVKSIGVNPVDTYIREGIHVIKPPLPYTPGVDGSGIVEDIGENVTKFKKGDRVYWARTVTGCCAEFALVNEWETFQLHDKLSFQQGAAVGVSYGTSYRAVVYRAKLRPGETVFIHGASGAIGLASCQIARSLGAIIVGTAGTEQGMKLLLANGAHLAFNHREEGYIEKIKAAVKSFDVIIEMLANVNLERDLELTGLGGRLVIVGSRGSIEITPRAVMTNEVNVIGAGLYRATEAEWAEMEAFFFAGQEQGWLNPVVGQEYSLEEAKQSQIEVIEHKNGSHGKIVINV